MNTHTNKKWCSYKVLATFSHGLLGGEERGVLTVQLLLEKNHKSRENLSTNETALVYWNTAISKDSDLILFGLTRPTRQVERFVAMEVNSDTRDSKQNSITFRGAIPSMNHLLWLSKYWISFGWRNYKIQKKNKEYTIPVRSVYLDT